MRRYDVEGCLKTSALEKHGIYINAKWASGYPYNSTTQEVKRGESNRNLDRKIK